MREGYTSSQPLPTLADTPLLSKRVFTKFLFPWDPPHVPHPWTPKFIPENWVYTDGSDIKGQPRLGAAVVNYIPTRTTVYIDASGKEETRTIMWAELVAVHMTRTTFATHN
jgi:hypothetical protein